MTDVMGVSVEIILPWALGLISSGVIAIAGLLFRLNVQGAVLNTTLSNLIRQFEVHIQGDREDFAKVLEKVAGVRQEQSSVAASLVVANERIEDVAADVAQVAKDTAAKVKEEKDE